MPSISSTRSVWNTGWPNSNATIRSAQHTCASGLPASVARLKQDFPGDTASGILDESDEAFERFEEFGNDEPCPALNPVTGGCDVYPWRPMTCRVFGPPVRSEGGLGVCELCYHGASEEEIAACEMKVDPDGLESKLVEEVEQSGRRGQTIVAFVLAS